MLKIYLVALIYSVFIGLTAAHDDESAKAGGIDARANKKPRTSGAF